MSKEILSQDEVDALLRGELGPGERGELEADGAREPFELGQHGAQGVAAVQVVGADGDHDILDQGRVAADGAGARIDAQHLPAGDLGGDDHPLCIELHRIGHAQIAALFDDRSEAVRRILEASRAVAE